MATKAQAKEIISRLRILVESGMSENEIMDVINKMNLPFALHLFITGNFGLLMDDGMDGYKFRIKHGLN